LKSYKQKQRWQFFLFLSAVIVGVSSLTYTNQLVKKMSLQEQIKAKMLANAWTQIVRVHDNTNLDFYAGIIEENHTIPVIVTDSAENIIMTRNLDTARLNNPRYISRKLRQMKEHADPIVIPLSSTEKQYLFYSKSVLLIQLQYYPYIQLAIVLLFIAVAYFAFNTSRRFEQNQVWIGLSKETAHQLGTPISSLMAWLEMMRIRNGDKEMLMELEKDITRLEKITERFSKIGSQPVLAQQNVITVIETAVNYIKTRSSDKIKFILSLPEQEIMVPLNTSLFEWVIENLCKNAIDALQGQGEIKITALELSASVQIDVSDTGMGMPKSMFNTVFKPGFTTKKKGWGLGLSLVKRIVEEYHDGKVYVHQSELNKGTVFRIILKKNEAAYIR
jgi:K+-sensing histidine kinase KdpD